MRDGLVKGRLSVRRELQTTLRLAERFAARLFNHQNFTPSITYIKFASMF